MSDPKKESDEVIAGQSDERTDLSEKGMDLRPNVEIPVSEYDELIVDVAPAEPSPPQNTAPEEPAE